MSRIIKSSEFYKIAEENEFFIWHFIVPDKTGLAIQPYNYIDENPLRNNPLKEIIDLTKIPYFESKTEEEYDFLMNLSDGFSKKMWSEKFGFNPVIIGFNRRKKVTSTFDGICYCTEGLLEIIFKLNPQYLLNLD